MLYFAHGAQLAASRAALRSTSKETYEIRVGPRADRGGALRGDLLPRDELALRPAHVALETDWDAATVELRKVAPYLDHLAYARELFEADTTKSGANER